MSGPSNGPAFSAADRNAAFVLRLRERGVRDTAVLRAMEQVPRERFVPARYREHARRDIALPLPFGQSMIAPTTVAAMLSLLGLEPGARVLEVGTGSGFVTALLLRLGAGPVLSLERYAGLSRAARDTLDEAAARIETGDGLGEVGGLGRFDRILVNGLCPRLPAQLCEALAPEGRLVAGVATAEGPRLVTVERAGEGAPTPSLGKGSGKGPDRGLGVPVRLPPLTPGRAAVL